MVEIKPNITIQYFDSKLNKPALYSLQVTSPLLYFFSSPNFFFDWGVPSTWFITEYYGENS